MAYSITYKPRREVQGIGPATATIDTAAAAWAFIQQLEASDEIVMSIRDAKGQLLNKNQLKTLASDETS